METGEGHLEGPIRFTCESTPVLILILVAFLCVLLLLVVSSPSRSDERRNPSFEFFSLFLSAGCWGLSRISRARPATENREEPRSQKNPEEPRRTRRRRTPARKKDPHKDSDPPLTRRPYVAHGSNESEHKRQCPSRAPIEPGLGLLV